MMNRIYTENIEDTQFFSFNYYRYTNTNSVFKYRKFITLSKSCDSMLVKKARSETRPNLLSHLQELKQYLPCEINNQNT